MPEIWGMKGGEGLVFKGGDAGELINWERAAQGLFVPTEGLVEKARTSCKFMGLGTHLG